MIERNVEQASEEPIDIDSNAMLVEETENSSSFAQSGEVIVFLFLHVPL